MKVDQSLIPGLFGILACQLLGELIRVLTRIPLPGPVLGMLIFFGYLQLRRPGAQSSVVRVADGLLRNMQLFFVPPGVGLITHFALLRAEWVSALGGLVLAWVAALVMTAVTAAGLMALRRRMRGATP